MSQEASSLIVGVPRETFPGERRVALVPATAATLSKKGVEVVVEAGAGAEAGFPDAEYTERGARVLATRAEVFSQAQIIAQVRAAGANPDAGQADCELLQAGQVLIAQCEPLAEAQSLDGFKQAEVSCFSLELVPRITRAQSMDVLSSMATVAGYKAVLLAAETLPRMFPMMMTAAGTITPARVFVVGAGVAGLQAIATAKRLGAVVRAYDIRPVVREQVESVGGKFVELELSAGDAEGKGGYAKAMDDEFYRKQREVMTEVVRESDVVITTAAIPGKQAPILVTGEMVKEMAPGSVLVDLAAERGGNCDLTKPGETIIEHGVSILGPINLPASVPYHASEMYSRNMSTFLLNMVKDGAWSPDFEDEIVKETLVTHEGEIVHERVREALGLEPNTGNVVVDEPED